MELIYSGKIAGVSFEPAKSGIRRLHADLTRKTASSDEHGDPVVKLVHDPKNPYDNQAIRVIVDEVFIGHIPKPFNDKILKVGIEKTRTILDKFNYQSDVVVGANIEVTLTK